MSLSSSPCRSSGNHFQGYSRRQLKVLTAKSMADLVGQHSGRGWAGQRGKYKHRVFTVTVFEFAAVAATAGQCRVLGQ